MLTFFNFKRNIFGRKVSERTLLSGWMSKVWILDFYSFLNEIFSAEKCSNGILYKVWMARFEIFFIFKRNIFGWKVSEWNNRPGLNGKVCSFFSFSNEIFSVEKSPNGIIDKVWKSKVWILHFYSFLNEIFSAEKCPNGIIDKVWMSKVCGFFSFSNEIFSGEKCLNEWIDKVWMARFVVFSCF